MSRSTSTKFLLLCACVVLSAYSAFGQQKEFELNVDVSLIPLDVTVFDSQKNTVTTLTKGDFLIKEDGILQEIQNFENADAPYHVLLLFDTSGSTRNQFPFMIEASNRFFASLGPTDPVSVASFDDRVVKLLEWRTRLGPSQQISLSARGAGTDFYGALRWAVDELSRLPGRKGCLVLTDGIDGRIATSADESEFQRALKAVEQSQSAFYFVAINPGVNSPVVSKARQHMEQLAQRSGGRVLSPTSLSDVAPLYERIAKELGSSYTLAYASSRPEQDGTYRRIDVATKQPGLHVSQSRTGYYAKGNLVTSVQTVPATASSLSIAGTVISSAATPTATNMPRSSEPEPSTRIAETIASAVRRSLETEAASVASPVAPVSPGAPAPNAVPGSAASPVPTAVPVSAPTQRLPGIQPPVLITPIEHALLSLPERSEWRFSWEDVPNARRYQMHVNAPGISAPVIEAETRTTSYSVSKKGLLSAGENLQGWSWQVRAQASDGMWGDWSESRPFDVFAGKPLK